MGADGSKYSPGNQHEQTEILMQHNMDIARRLSHAQRADRSKNNGVLFAMGKHMFADMRRPGSNGFGLYQANTIEIEGIKYTLLEFIGKGGFGQVFKAQMIGKDCIAAIKVMKNSPTVREELKSEIHFLKLMKKIKIQPLPIIKYFGCSTTNDSIHMAMELASNDLLQFWFDHIANTNPEQKFFLGLTIIIYVLRALAFLEQLEIIHGDIKPQNLVIIPRNDRFCIKLIDFGTIEKMDSFRPILTVKADKPHTLYFASPEFIKRNSQNVVSRRLHKKSDAWAAGVMFYFFFFERLPWKDQYDFDDFCNNPHSRDIVIPQQGGFKRIIELLLKKDPEQRASAKSTIMQMKSHPQIRDIVQSLNDDFCPVDDVCHMRISDDVRNDLAELARPGHVVRVVKPPNSGTRTRCRYGENCYRHDRAHREDFAHPGDRDYYRNIDNNDGKIACRYGSDCYRFDTDHRNKYIHPRNSPQTMCHHGIECFNFDDDHRARYAHPSSRSTRGSTSCDSPRPWGRKENCWFGANCTDKNVEHRRRFSHPNSSNNDNGKINCRYGGECTDYERVHRSQYLHPPPCSFGNRCTKSDDREHRFKYSH